MAQLIMKTNFPADREEESIVLTLTTFCIAYCKTVQHVLKASPRRRPRAESYTTNSLASLLIWTDTIREQDELLRAIEDAEGLLSTVIRALITISKCMLRGTLSIASRVHLTTNGTQCMHDSNYRLQLMRQNFPRAWKKHHTSLEMN